MLIFRKSLLTLQQDNNKKNWTKYFHWILLRKPLSLTTYSTLVSVVVALTQLHRREISFGCRTSRTLDPSFPGPKPTRLISLSLSLSSISLKHLPLSLSLSFKHLSQASPSLSLERSLCFVHHVSYMYVGGYMRVQSGSNLRILLWMTSSGFHLKRKNHGQNLAWLFTKYVLCILNMAIPSVISFSVNRFSAFIC